MSDKVELIVRFHPVGGEDVSVLTRDFGSEQEAMDAIVRALDERRSLVLAQARYNREEGGNAVVVNLANVVSIRLSTIDNKVTGQYL